MQAESPPEKGEDSARTNHANRRKEEQYVSGSVFVAKSERAVRRAKTEPTQEYTCTNKVQVHPCRNAFVSLSKERKRVGQTNKQIEAKLQREREKS